MCSTTALGTLENGNVTFTATIFDSVATYSCNSGYTLTGDASRRCQGDGTWSGSIPTCIGIYETSFKSLVYLVLSLVDCGALDNPDNGMVDVSETVLDSVATYSCNTGYTLTGDATRTCQGNSTWSGAIPTCVGMKQALNM